MEHRGADRRHNFFSVYLTLCLDEQKLRKFLIKVRIAATVDAMWICIYVRLMARECHRSVCIIFLREASTLLVLL